MLNKVILRRQLRMGTRAVLLFLVLTIFITACVNLSRGAEPVKFDAVQQVTLNAAETAWEVTFAAIQTESANRFVGTSTAAAIVGEIEYFVWSGNHVDAVSETSISLAHAGDSVILNGPATFRIVVRHHVSLQDPLIEEEPKIIKVPWGQSITIINDEGTLSHPGDWNTYIYLESTNR